MTDSFDDFEVPNPENPFNFLLDTTVYNRFIEYEEWLAIAKQSVDHGFRYYKTATQDWELRGFGAKIYNADTFIPTDFRISEGLEKKIPLFQDIKAQLKVKRVSSIANLMPNHWVLDGTYRTLDNSLPRGITTEKILAFNEKLRNKHPFAQHYDAMTAEAALYNHCILVTDDSDLRNLVNEDSPNTAITTEELIRNAQVIINSGK